MKNRDYAGIDFFRIPASFMVIAIHTAPFSGVSGTLDHLLTYCLGRVAVPFFLMTTGYFVLAPWVKGGDSDLAGIKRFLIKNTAVYAAASLLYLPIAVYSGNAPGNVWEALKQILFDGTFYHLWYFPAVILGCILVLTLLKCFTVRTSIVIVFLLYFVGICGDSLYGAAKMIPGAELFYDAVFTVSGYTRNGIFFAPMFLMMGALTGQDDRAAKRGKERLERGWSFGAAAGLAIALTLMLSEGYAGYRLGLHRHDSMYLFLVPVMHFLFRLLLLVPGWAAGWVRTGSMLIYILHPAVLIVLRGLSGILGMTGLLVENTFMQFVTVCAVSFTAAVFIMKCAAVLTRRRGGVGGR